MNTKHIVAFAAIALTGIVASVWLNTPRAELSKSSQNLNDVEKPDGNLDSTNAPLSNELRVFPMERSTVPRDSSNGLSQNAQDLKVRGNGSNARIVNSKGDTLFKADPEVGI